MFCNVNKLLFTIKKKEYVASAQTMKVLKTNVPDSFVQSHFDHIVFVHILSEHLKFSKVKKGLKWVVGIVWIVYNKNI